MESQLHRSAAIVTQELISVIIPVHNRTPLVIEAIGSVRAQQWPNVEILVVDDGSTDETPRTLEALAREDSCVRVLPQENRGPGAAREHGRSMARGELIQYLDSDDLLLPGKFAAQAAALRASPESGIAYGRTRYSGPGGVEIQPLWKRPRHGATQLFPSFLDDRWWETSNPLYRREVVDRAGSWTDLWLEEDWEYDCRFGAMGVRLAFVDAFVAEHRDAAPDRLSRDHGVTAWRLTQRARAHLLMADHARRAAVDFGDPDVRSFCRRLFLLSRQCGARGLVRQSKDLFEASRSFVPAGESTVDYRLYRGVASLVGWRRAGRLAAWRDRTRASFSRSDA